MQIIISHVNTDFDALASLVAANKLYPEATIVITDKQNIPVSQFLNIYRDSLDLVPDTEIDWEEVTDVILVDEASLERTGNYLRSLNREDLHITVYDHHRPKESDVQKDAGIIAPVGAAVTLLIEEIQKQELPITPFEATLFGLGIYTDTGSFTYDITTARDYEAAAYLIQHGMNLQMVKRFSNEIFSAEQQGLLDALFQNMETHYIEGLQIVVSYHTENRFYKGLATLTRKLIEVSDADAALSVVHMRNRTYIVGRASSERIDLRTLLKKWQGGGHAQAGSATVKSKDYKEIFDAVVESLPLIIKPAVTARDMMASPVKTIDPDTTIEEAGRLMYKYGHSGFPVVQDGLLKGIITRRDLEKANHHGLGHAPVKGYMTTNLLTIGPDTTEEEIQQLIIERNIGRLPVVEGDKLIGIVSRTNVIEVLHNERQQARATEEEETRETIQESMKAQLDQDVYDVLSQISETAEVAGVDTYLIGGIVRDIFLGRKNDDVDIVVEGDGVHFAKQLQADYGGELVAHDSFGTATWTTEAGLEIDVASSRLEFYDEPAALPTVETSTLREDLSRRDFTMNAMAIHLGKESFGSLLDPYGGRQALRRKELTILHNLSFVEDPTRVFRGVRFELRFGFRMDAQTEQLALQSIGQVKELSAQRIIEEMKKLFHEGDPEQVIRRLFELRFWQQFGISDAYKEGSLSQVEHWSLIQKELDLALRINELDSFFIPFVQAGVFDRAKAFALTRSTAKFLQEVEQLEHNKAWQDVSTIGECHRTLKDYSTEAIVFQLAKQTVQASERIRSYVKKRGTLVPLLTGRDLIELGYEPGAHFSELFLELEIAILADEVETKDEALAWVRENDQNMK